MTIQTATVPIGEPTGPNAPDTQRPDWLPEKFKSVKDMADAYKALESKVGTAGPAAVPQAPTPPVRDGDGAGPGGAVMATPQIPVPAAGGDLKPYFEEFSKTGSLSEDSFKALEKKGLPRDVVEMYVEGYMAKQQQAATQLLSTVGGAEVWSQVSEWAQKSLPVQEIEAFNGVLNSGDQRAIQVAMKGMRAQYDLAVGTQGRRLDGNNAPSTIQPYASQAQWLKAIDDPRYADDPAYRKEVMDRLSVSNF